jgi:hypothetical protein
MLPVFILDVDGVRQVAAGIDVADTESVIL